MPSNDSFRDEKSGTRDAFRGTRYLHAGDRALSVEFGNTISQSLNETVLQFDSLLREACLPGVEETVPSYRALLVYYDPLIVEYKALVERLCRLEARISPTTIIPRRMVEIPCCYDPELGFDIVGVGERHGLTAQEVAQIHCSGQYITYFIGFAPGFPYLGGLPDQIVTPRLASPRGKIPRGSVGIGGVQCTIYSVESPGGVWIIGRTPLRLYDPSLSQPVLLQPGDRIRFRAIDRAEYDELSRSVDKGMYRTCIRDIV